MENEWARTADDVLWRRSKLGLRVSAADARRLDDCMQGRASAPPRPRRWRAEARCDARASQRHERWRQTHIDDVSLTFANGTLNILLGPTLSGKTSLMR